MINKCDPTTITLALILTAHTQMTLFQCSVHKWAAAGGRVPDNKFCRESGRELWRASSRSQISFYLWAGRVSPVTRPQLPACVLLSCVYIIPPALDCDNCDCDIRWRDDITSEAVSDYTFTPLCCVCVGGEWGMRDRYWMGWSGVRIGWEPLWGNKTSTCARCHGAWPCCC